MKHLTTRLTALETKKRALRPVHVVVWNAHKGQTEDEALDAYGRDKIGADDMVIMRSIVAAKNERPAPCMDY